MTNWVAFRKMLKRNDVLALIRQSSVPLSRFAIKKLTSYSNATISNTVDELIRQGLLIEDARGETGKTGRKPALLHLNPEGGYLLGVEFNIAAMHSAVLDFSGRVLFQRRAKIPEGITREPLLRLLMRQAQQCMDFLGLRQARVLGIGLGIPGYIDVQTGVSLTFPQLADWDNVPLVRLMEERFSRPCYIGNNVSVMGLVFKWLKDYHEHDDFLLVSIRSGVRCIPVLGQQPYAGRINNTGEVGHIKVPGSTRQCDCGRTGCLNAEVSDVALRAILEEGFAQGKWSALQAAMQGARPSSALLVRSALAGEPQAIRLVQRSGELMGGAVAIAANLYAPQKIILSGRLVKAGELFFAPLLRRAQQDCLPAIYQGLTISASPFGDGIGALGAATLVLERAFNPTAAGRSL